MHLVIPLSEIVDKIMEMALSPSFMKKVISHLPMQLMAFCAPFKHACSVVTAISF